MKKIFTVLTLIFLLAGFQLQAQTGVEPEKSSESKTIPSDTQQQPAIKGCHGGAVKPGCCAAKEGSSAKKSKKKSKDGASCCAASGGAKCCANGKDGEHADKPCHPGCTMPCCAKKE